MDTSSSPQFMHCEGFLLRTSPISSSKINCWPICCLGVIGWVPTFLIDSRHDGLCTHKKMKMWAKLEGGYLNNNNKYLKTAAYLCCQWCKEHREATMTMKGAFFNELIDFAWKWRDWRPISGKFKKTCITFSKIGLPTSDCLSLNVWNLGHTDMKRSKTTG